MAGFLRIAVAIVIAWVLVVQVRGCLMTDEDHVRALIAHAEDGWNSASARETVEPLSDDFVLVPFRQGKSWLRGILFNIYENNRNPKTHEFLWDANVDWETIELRFVDPEQTRAQVRGMISLQRNDGRTEGNYTGLFGVEARKHEGEWEIVSLGLQGLGTSRGRRVRTK